MAITQQIGQFPQAPNSSSDTPQEFNTKANNFVSYQALTYVPEVNQWAVEANQLAVDINNIVATIPTGTINDTAIGADKVYSNQKTEALYAKSADLPTQSDTGTILTGGALTAVGIIGTNPSATLWADGSITGKSGNGEFAKWANGKLECWDYSALKAGTLNGELDIIWETPILFIDIPSTHNGGMGRNEMGTIIVCGKGVVDATISYIKFRWVTNGLGTPIPLKDVWNWSPMAIGRWK